MSVCVGIRRDGMPCVSNAADGSDYCFHHDPDRSEERKANAQRGGITGGRGRGRSRAEQVEQVRKDMRAVASAVLNGKVSSRAADSIIKALNGELRALTELHKIQDVAALERRLDELEDIFR
jgi:hypothetical protein